MVARESSQGRQRRGWGVGRGRGKGGGRGARGGGGSSIYIVQGAQMALSWPERNSTETKPDHRLGGRLGEIQGHRGYALSLTLSRLVRPCWRAAVAKALLRH